MAHIVADGLEREAGGHQPLDARVPARMGAWAGHGNAGAMQVLAGDAGDPCVGQGRAGSDVSPKKLSALHDGRPFLR